MAVHTLQAGYNVEIDTTYDCKKRFTIPITKPKIKLTMVAYQFTTHQKMLYCIVDDVATATRLSYVFCDFAAMDTVTPATVEIELERNDLADWELDQEIDLWFQTPSWDIYGHADFKSITFEMID